MFFNYDSFEVVAIAFVVSGILIYSLYYSSAAGTHINNESLINTSSLSESIPDSISVIGPNNLQYIEANIQTADTNVETKIKATITYVNTEMQTSDRLWYESKLQNTVEPQTTASNEINRIYDTSNPTDLADLINDPTVYNYYDIVDNNYYFYTDSHVYSVIRSLIIEILGSIN